MNDAPSRCGAMGAMAARMHGGARAVVAALGLATQGCTVVGLLTGAVVDGVSETRYEPERAETLRLEKGQRIRVATLRGVTRVGTYDGFVGSSPRDTRSYVLLAVSDRTPPVIGVPTDEITEIGVAVAGKGWLYGAITGAVVDIGLALYVSTTIGRHEGEPN